MLFLLSRLGLALADPTIQARVEGFADIEGRSCQVISLWRPEPREEGRGERLSERYWLDLGRSGQVIRHEAFAPASDGLASRARDIRLKDVVLSTGRTTWIPATKSSTAATTGSNIRVSRAGSCPSRTSSGQAACASRCRIPTRTPRAWAATDTAVTRDPFNVIAGAAAGSLASLSAATTGQFGHITAPVLGGSSGLAIERPIQFEVAGDRNSSAVGTQPDPARQ